MVGLRHLGRKMKSFEQWLVENYLAGADQTLEEIASAIMLYRQYKKYVNSEERNEKELRSIRNAIEIIKKLLAENAELRKRLEN